jgi:hypothetical protein
MPERLSKGKNLKKYEKIQKMIKVPKYFQNKWYYQGYLLKFVVFPQKKLQYWNYQRNSSKNETEPDK